MIRSRSERIGWAIAAAALCAACVPSNAGYDDVRSLTAERLSRDVRWYEHDSRAGGDERVHELLSRPLTADTAVQIALLNNQGLQAAFEELGVGRARWVEALRLPNPTIDAALRFNDGGSRRPTIELDALIDVSELVFLPSRGSAASAALDASKLGVAGAIIDLAFETRRSFYSYQAAAQILELRRSIAEALRAAFEVATQLHAAGNVTELQFASERAMYEESRVSYTAAEAAFAASREEVSALLGVWGPAAMWTAEARLPEPEPESSKLDELEKRALDRSLELEQLRRRFAAASKGVNLARVRGWVPELRAGVSVERDSEPGAEWAIGPAAAIEVPLFYQGQGEAGAALAEMRRQQRLYADTAVRIRAAARAAAVRLRVAAKSVAYYKSVLLPLRQQIVDETQLHFNAMNVSAFQLLQAKREQIEAARVYVDLLHDYWSSRTRVDQLLAGRLPGGAVPGPTLEASSSSSSAAAH